MKQPAAEAASSAEYTADVQKRQKRLRRVSHQDIAREANVSRVTVSLVLAGKDQASEETRKRVMEVAQRLRYRPNLLVHGMQSGRTHTVGIIMPTSMHFHGQVARGIHDELISQDYVPIQLWVDPQTDTKASELEQIHRLVDRRIDGIIIWPADVSVPDVHFREIWQRHIPLVTVDRETTTHADHVGTDEELGGRSAAEHLLSLGHKHVGLVTFASRTGNVFSRGTAFTKAMEAGGGKVEIITSGRTEDLDAPLREFLGRSANRATAMFCVTDVMAMKVYSVASGLGLAIPRDLSVVGYADFPFAVDLVPPLTTVRQDPYQMGRLSAKTLLDRVFDRSKSDTPQRIHLAPELIVRKSTAAPASR
jgi:LacI family transcriptional regulator